MGTNINIYFGYLLLMKREKFLIFENINRIHEISDVNPIAGKHLVVVDIQPEYESAISFIPSFVDFLNSNYESLSNLTFLFNGHDTLGMIEEHDYKMWWLDHGLDEHIIDSVRFYDKGYAFFRYCIDYDIDEEDVSELVRHMIEKGVNDSRDLDKEFWNSFIEKYNKEDIRELLEFSDDCINIPDLMEELEDYRGIVLCGGGIKQCLKEVEIALNALNKPFTILTKYTY
jgi:hypothetical protein